MKDTMIPTKPEDYDTGIQTDKKILKKEVEYILNPDHFGMLNMHTSTGIDEVIPKLFGGFGRGDKKEWKEVLIERYQKVNCTCPKIIHTKKRAKQKNLEVIGKATNGYMLNHYCPIHNNSVNK